MGRVLVWILTICLGVLLFVSVPLVLRHFLPSEESKRQKAELEAAHKRLAEVEEVRKKMDVVLDKLEKAVDEELERREAIENDPTLSRVQDDTSVVERVEVDLAGMSLKQLDFWIKDLEGRLEAAEAAGDFDAIRSLQAKAHEARIERARRSPGAGR